MAEASRLSDEMISRLMAVGQVDVLVGLPTLNNAATVGTVVRAIHSAFAHDFLRERTVLINSDGGSDDGTPAIIRGESADEIDTLTASHSLRTSHRISVPYHGLPGKGSALRQIFAAADLTQARVVAVLDPDVSNYTPAAITGLIRPVLNQAFDYVSPIQPRHPLDGALVSQLVRPLVRAAYGWRVSEPLAVEFAGSSRFVSSSLDQDVWDTPLAANGIDMWITAAALSGGFRCCEVQLGRRLHAPASTRLAFPEVFKQVVGSVFDCLARHSAYWTGRTGSEALTLAGDPYEESADAPAVDPAALTRSFSEDFANLRPVLASVLSDETLAGLSRITDPSAGRFMYDDELWVRTVYEFLGAHHAGVMNRDHVLQALAPLYLGRAGSFLAEAGADPASAPEVLNRLGGEFERLKPYAIERWHATNAKER